MTGPTWDEFAQALARELSRYGDGMYLVISERARPWHFAQFYQGLTRLDAHVSGETVEEPPGTMQETPRGREILESLGWGPPKPDGTMWHQELAWPLTSGEYRRLADDVVTVLRDVNGIAGPADLMYQAWEGRKGNRAWTANLPGVEPEPGD